jgi:hypothetical protein
VSDGGAALRLLARRKLAGFWRKQLRRARTPKGALLALVGAGAFVLWFGSVLFNARSQGARPQAEEVELYAAGALAVLSLLTFTNSFSLRGLYLQPNEIETLFSAPVSRPDLIRYRLRSAIARSLFGSLFFGWMFARRAPVPAYAFSGAVVAMLTLPMVGQAFSLVLGDGRESPRGQAREAAVARADDAERVPRDRRLLRDDARRCPRALRGPRLLVPRVGVGRTSARARAAPAVHALGALDRRRRSRAFRAVVRRVPRDRGRVVARRPAHPGRLPRAVARDLRRRRAPPEPRAPRVGCDAGQRERRHTLVAHAVARRPRPVRRRRVAQGRLDPAQVAHELRRRRPDRGARQRALGDRVRHRRPATRSPRASSSPVLARSTCASACASISARISSSSASCAAGRSRRGRCSSRRCCPRRCSCR